MASKPPVVINGARVGRFRSSWLLFKETWRFFRLDPEILAVPFLAGLLNLVLSVAIVGAALGVHFYLVPLGSFQDMGGDSSFTVENPLFYLFVFLTYTAAAFTLAFSQGAIAHTVITRLRGGDATLGVALGVACRRWRALLAWSLITATVGLLLRLIAERFKLVGRLVVALIGVAWEVLTYFVAPAIVIENHGSIDAIKQSGRTLKQTFGETVMTNIGLGIAFFCIYLLVMVFSVGLIVFGSAFDSGWLMLVTFGLVFLLFLGVGLLNAALQGVLKTLLYAYVMEHRTPLDFNAELLQNVLVRKDGANETVSDTTNHGV